MTEDEIVGWHHRLDGQEFEQASRDGEGYGSLVCCSPCGGKKLDMTERLNRLTEESCKISILWESIPENMRPSGWTEFRKEF